MWRLEPHARVFLCLGFTDMRKSINALSVLVEYELGAEAGSGDLFVFCNRGRSIVKVLYWDRNGFCLWQKRLESHRFHWPRGDDELHLIGREELGWLLDGLDIEKAHSRLRRPMVI
jgi:transposase